MAEVSPQDLGDKFNTQEKEGFYAEIDDEDRVTHFGYYRNADSNARQWHVEIDYEKRSARFQRSDRRSFAAGAAAGDGETPEQRYKSWVIQWLSKVMNQTSGQIECGFCGKLEHECKKVIAGPRTYMCSDCIALAKSHLDKA